MDKIEFLRQLDTSRSDWEILLAQIETEKKEVPGVVGGWSIKDLIAHILWFEKEMLELLKSRSFTGSEWWGLSADERNLRIYEAYRNLNLTALQKKEQRIYAAMRAALENLKAEAYHEAAYFEGMPEDWVPWQMIEGNSYEHYRQHITDIQIWLEKNT